MPRLQQRPPYHSYRSRVNLVTRAASNRARNVAFRHNANRILSFLPRGRSPAERIQAAWRGRRTRAGFTNPFARPGGRALTDVNNWARNLNFDDYFNTAGMEAPATSRLRWEFDEL
ncbi:hypothetical protein [Circoviridae sp.]|nr:hypothetical protein [Circoviridae sp.]